MPVDVILPCLNEAGALPWVLSRMPMDIGRSWSTTVRDDGSAEVARSLGATVVEELHRGFGAACHAGLLHATSDVVCFMDADGSLDPRQLPLVADPVSPGRPTSCSADALRKSRRVAGACATCESVLARQIRARTGWPLRDLGPMRAARREPLLALGLVDRRFGYPLEMVLRAAGRLAGGRG